MMDYLLAGEEKVVFPDLDDMGSMLTKHGFYFPERKDIFRFILQKQSKLVVVLGYRDISSDPDEKNQSKVSFGMRVENNSLVFGEWFGGHDFNHDQSLADKFLEVVGTKDAWKIKLRCKQEDAEIDLLDFCLMDKELIRIFFDHERD